MTKFRRFPPNLVHKKLHNLIEPYLLEKKFTHCFIGWGSLKDSSLQNHFMVPQGDFFFDLASLTKVLATLPLVLNTFCKNSITELDLKIKDLLSKSDLEGYPKFLHNISLQELLRHRAHFSAWQNFWMNHLDPNYPVHSINRNQRRDLIFQRLSPPILESEHLRLNVQYLYSDLGYLLLGLLLESVHKNDLEIVFREYCSELNLDMDSTLFFPKGPKKHGFVTTGFCPIRERNLIGEVHDENAAALGGSCAHAGLFGSGLSLVKFLTQFFNSTLGKELMQKNLLMYKDCVNGEFALGWQKHQFDFVENIRVFRHLGFTGTGIYLFPDYDSYITILTNRIISSRVSSWMQSFRQEVCKLLWEEGLKFRTDRKDS